MRWEDERYVRLYTRDTVTWKLLPWQSKCLLPLLLRKLDRAGVLELGQTQATRAVAALVEMPLEIVEVGLGGLISSTTVECTEQAIVLPNFLEAQESAASDAQRLREWRAKRRDLARRNEMFLLRNETLPERNETLPKRNAVKRGETPSRAVPSRTVPLKTAATAKSGSRSRSKEKESDPRLQPLTEALANAFQQVRGEKYKHLGARDTDALKRMLSVSTPEEIERRWRWAITEDGWNGCSDIEELGRKWNHYSGMEPGHETSGGEKRFDPNRGILRSHTPGS